MDAARELEQQIRGIEEDAISNQENRRTTTANLDISCLPKLTHYKWWLRISTYILSLLVGQVAATLLGRLYFDKGGNSIWIATIVESAAFPILVPLLFYFRKPALTSTSLPLLKQTLYYFAIGLVLTAANLMYSYGLLYMPVSTYSLLCATQLPFNAVFSYFINSQKFTALVLNSVVLLTISACLLAANADTENNASTFSREKYIIGFICTLGASAIYSLYISLVQYFFEKVIKDESFNTVLAMQIYTSFVATCACVVGLFAGGEWRSLKGEMEGYQKGKVSYFMTLVWTAIGWQMSLVSVLGLISEVSALFSNVISTLALPLVPVFAVVFFHDKMEGVKVISLILAIWGFLSYIYQHYLDDYKGNLSRRGHENEVPDATDLL